MQRSARKQTMIRIAGWPTIVIAWICGIHVCRYAVSDDTLFIDRVYPVLAASQCNLCHSDNGVASGYGLEFPNRNATRDQILAFGYSLFDYVDVSAPEQSPLLLKPSNRVEHTGGVRIKPESDQERLLNEWIKHLIAMTEPDWEHARDLIKRSSKWDLEPLTVRRLTHSQFNNTVRDLLGDPSQPANRFPKEDFIRGFKNQIDGQGISPLLAEAYSETAERIAKSVFRGGDTRNLLPLKPSNSTDSTAAGAFVKQFGERAFRRALTPEEVDKYSKLLFQFSKQSNDFMAGSTAVVEAMLQSPYFLYQIEQSRSPQNASYAIASRLAFLVWDTMPSFEMLEMAKLNELIEVKRVEQLARKMLEDERAKSALDEFLSQWMRFDNVIGATRDRRRYREFNPEIAAAMVDETRQLFRHLVWNDQNFMKFFTADFTFVSANLAQFYGFASPLDDVSPIQYPSDSGRAGVLGHGSFLVSTSKPSETSPTARGLFVRSQFLAQEIAPPPPGVNSVLPEIAEDKPMTNRQRLDLHLNSDACASCHRLIDPIGLGLEQYDAIGKYQQKMTLRFGAKENAVTKELDLDCSANVQGIPGSRFSSPKELGTLLAAQEVTQRCIVKQYFRYAFGREESAADQALIDEAFRRFRDSGFHFREIVVAFVTSPQFLNGATENASFQK